MDEMWWREFFDEHYEHRFLRQVSDLEVDFLVEHLQVAVPGRIFDQCCGVGRVSAALRQRGYHCLGVDQSSHYVQVARRSGLEVVQADGRTFVTGQPCDGAFNFFSSFGFFHSDSQNFLLLQCAARSLRRGGRFVLDFTNTLRILDEFQPVMVQPLRDGREVRRLSEILWEEGMLGQRWQFFDAGGQLQMERHTRLRLYLPEQLGQLLRAAGLRPLKLLGGYHHQEFDSSAPRMIWVSQRA